MYSIHCNAVEWYHEYHEGYLEYHGGSSVPWGISWCMWRDIISTVGLFSTVGGTIFCYWVPHGTENPLRYWAPPPHSTEHTLCRVVTIRPEFCFLWNRNFKAKSGSDVSYIAFLICGYNNNNKYWCLYRDSTMPQNGLTGVPVVKIISIRIIYNFFIYIYLHTEKRAHVQEFY